MSSSGKTKASKFFRLLAGGVLVLVWGVGGNVAGLQAPALGSTVSRAYADTGCQLHSSQGDVQHVVYVQFDNTHFVRDNPNVPSDLEQMPHLLNFLEQNGVVLTNHHTPLISHTATDILTSLTGVYGDRHGVPISNSFRYFKPDGTSSLGVSFAYWTDPIFDPTTSVPTDTTYNMLTATGTNAPAPWVPYTRAGCNVGSVATANTILENIATDIPTVFGPNSPQAQEVTSNPAQATADFVGVGIHCALSSSLCAGTNGGRPDALPQEPGGYNGYMGLFGHKYVAPLISPQGPLTDLNGNVISDGKGHAGFPGFDGMSASVSLSYVAAMQEHGVAVTYAYISDSHDNHATAQALGPGEPAYEAQLKANDNAFGTFFTRLANDGITPKNTLFVFTSDEGDHFVGGPPSPTNCDGINVTCSYPQIGEIDGNLAGLLATEQGVTTPFKVHSDSAPNVYIMGNPAPGTVTPRSFERALGQITAANPLTGATDMLANYLADPVEEKILHMVTSDPARTPTVTMFANPDYYLFAAAPNCNSPCVAEAPGFAWNHGDVAPDINTTWLGLVGPGVRNLGVDSTTWSDHTDIRPTMMSLLGLRDDYAHQGVVLLDDVYPWAIPHSLVAHNNTIERLAQVYKQINAPVGEFSLDTLRVSTYALESNSLGDLAYTQLESELVSLGQQRDLVAGEMSGMLEGAAFASQSIDQGQAVALIAQGQGLIAEVDTLPQSGP